MIDSAIFLLLVPGFFLVLAAVLTVLAVTRQQRSTAAWGAVAFFAAAVGASVDLFRPPGQEWLKWLALALHFVTLYALSLAFLSRKDLGLPRLAVAMVLVPLAFLPLFGLHADENSRTLLVQVAAFVLTSSVVWALIRAGRAAMIDHIAIWLLSLGAFSYLVRIFVFGAYVTEDSAGRFFDDIYNLVFHFMSAGFGFLAGISLLVAIGVDLVLDHARQSAIDPLTGLGNRRALNEAIDEEGRKLWRCGGVIVVDMDHFKRVNDAYGHPEGDRLLVAVAGALRARLSGCGHLCRLGGEEFLLLVEQRHKANVERLATIAHDAIAGVRLDGALRDYQPTASIGFHVRNAGATLSEGIRLADQALYRAKGLGRNCVVGARHANGITVMTEAGEPRAVRA